jgi:thiosulfate/3-mercaptopyruvate sulfurtransferase
MWADKRDVLAAVRGEATATLVNAVPPLPADTSRLPAEALRVMTTAIPGSVYVPYPALAEPGSSFLRTGADRARLFDAVPETGTAIAYCNSGLNAPLVGLSLRAAGREDVRVYDGSVEEWLSDPELPVERRSPLD